MIKLVTCIKRRKGMSHADFRSFWKSELLDKLIHKTAQMLNAKKYSKNTTLAVDANIYARMIRDGSEPFDGMIQYWFENASGIVSPSETRDDELVQEMLEYQQQFAEMDQCCSFFTDDNIETL